MKYYLVAACALIAGALMFWQLERQERKAKDFQLQLESLKDRVKTAEQQRLVKQGLFEVPPQGVSSLII